MTRRSVATGSVAVIVATLSLPTAAFAQDPPRRRIIASLDSLAAALRHGQRVPGMTILVAKGARTLVAKGFGYANLDHDVPARAHTVYGVGSITKQFVAAAVLRLAEQGKLRLDDDLATYLPEFPTHGRRVTLHHLLSHTSGLPGGPTLPGGRNPERIDHSRQELAVELNTRYAARPAEYAPGAGWAYQSINYSLLGLIVEKLSGRSLWEHLRTEFLVPLGMHATAQCDHGVVMKHRATGYVVPDVQNQPPAVAPYFSRTLALGGTGLCSSAPDLLAWQRALVEHRVLSKASYDLMTTPAVLGDGTEADYGYGVVRWVIGGEPVIFHTGGTFGYTAYLAHMPASDITVVVMVNANSDIFTIGPRVIRAARGLPQPSGLAVTREDITRFGGVFESGRVKLTAEERDGAFRAEVAGSNSFRFLFPATLLKQREREFAVGWEPDSRLTFLGDGARADSVLLRYAGRTITLKRVP